MLIIFPFGVWLARTLNPADYGMIGVLSVFTYLANALQESGFTAAIIRKERLTNEDLDVVFYMNVGIGGGLYILLFFCSGLIANFYGNPELSTLSRVVFLMFLLNSFSVVQNALLVRAMNFRTCTIINLVSILISYVIAIVSAIYGAGSYAIAFQMVSLALCRSVMLWLQPSSWRPRLTFKRDSFHQLFSFSFKLLFTNILNTLACRIFPSVIGKCYGTEPAGFYENAQRWGNMPQDFVTGTISTVSYPAISEVQRSDEEALRRVYRKSVRVTSFFVYPLFMGIMVCASNFIVSILGEKWLDTWPFVMFICVAGIFNGLNTANNNMLKTKGRSSDILAFEVVRNVATILFVFACIPLGVYWMMGGMVFVSFANYLIYSIKVDRLTGIRWYEHFLDIAPYALLMCVAALPAFLLNRFFPDVHHLLMLFIQVVVMVVVYLGCGFLLGSVILSEAWQLVKQKIFIND